MKVTVAVLCIVAATSIGHSAAQPGRDSRDDGAAARSDALLATPNKQTPVPQTNLFSTSPRLEQQVPKPGDDGIAAPPPPRASP